MASVTLVDVEDRECVGESPMAIYVREIGVMHGSDDKCIPKSLISVDSEVRKLGDQGTLIIPEWLAIKEELV